MGGRAPVVRALLEHALPADLVVDEGEGSGAHRIGRPVALEVTVHDGAGIGVELLGQRGHRPRQRDAHAVQPVDRQPAVIEHRVLRHEDVLRREVFDEIVVLHGVSTGRRRVL